MRLAPGERGNLLELSFHVACFLASAALGEYLTVGKQMIRLPVMRLVCVVRVRGVGGCWWCDCTLSVDIEMSFEEVLNAELLMSRLVNYNELEFI